MTVRRWPGSYVLTDGHWDQDHDTPNPRSPTPEAVLGGSGAAMMTGLHTRPEGVAVTRRLSSSPGAWRGQDTTVLRYHSKDFQGLA